VARFQFEIGVNTYYDTLMDGFSMTPYLVSSCIIPCRDTPITAKEFFLGIRPVHWPKPAYCTGVEKTAPKKGYTLHKYVEIFCKEY
jgi:hypothetical protein